MTAQELPLFPLDMVLFPGAPLTLHIFEERYRAMIAHCLDTNAPFGVVLIRHGHEVGEPAIHYRVGTMAQITASVRMEDGRYLITSTGQQRFRTDHVLHMKPYIVSLVTPLADESTYDTAIDSHDHELQEIYDRYWHGVTAATGVALHTDLLPQGFVRMTYYLAHRINVTNERKQRWLEVDALTRGREIINVLEAEIALFPRTQPTRPVGSPSMLWPWSWN